MSSRIIEKDILADVIPASGGDSVVVDLFGKDGITAAYCCQFVYDVLSFSAAACASATNIFINTDPDHPSQFLKTAHGLVTGLKVQVTTSGSLPTGISALTDYYVIKIDDDYFALANSLANAKAGTKVSITAVGSGTQTVTAVALAGASIKLQKSNDGTNWIDVATATSITVDGSNMVEASAIAYRYIKAVKAITAGAVDLQAKLLVIGSSI